MPEQNGALVAAAPDIMRLEHDPLAYLKQCAALYPNQNADSNQRLVTIRAEGGTVAKLATDTELRDLMPYTDDIKFQRWLSDSQTINDALILGNTALAFTFARIYAYQGVLKEDLVLAATTGIIDAVKAPNYDHRQPFNPYMNTVIHREIHRTIREEGSNIRITENPSRVLRAAFSLSQDFYRVNERLIKRDELRDALLALEEYPENEIDLAMGAVDSRVLSVSSLDESVSLDGDMVWADTVEGDYIDTRSIEGGGVRRRVIEVLTELGLGEACYMILDGSFGLTDDEESDEKIAARLGMARGSIWRSRKNILRLLAKDEELRSYW